MVMNFVNRSWRCSFLLVLTCAVIIAGCASYTERVKPTAVPEIRPGVLVGYLPPQTLPNSLALLPPPPAAGSVAFALDEEYSRRSFALPRYTGLGACDFGCRPDVSTGGRHIFLRIERPDHGKRYPASLRAAAPNSD